MYLGERLSVIAAMSATGTQECDADAEHVECEAMLS